MSLKNTKNNIKISSQINKENILSLIIKSYKEKFIERKTEVYYLIQIVNNISNKKWEIEKTILDFQYLYEKLFILYPKLPLIPKQTLFKITSFHILDKRKYGLQNFLQHCINRKEILLNEDFFKFLEIPKNSPDILGNSINKYDELYKFELSVKNFIYIKDKSILIVLLSDNDFISRDEASLDNILIIKSNNPEQKRPLGYIRIYEYINSEGNEKDINYEIIKLNKIWEKSFMIQTNTMYFDQKKEILCVGNDDGSIYIYKTKVEGNYKNMELMIDLKFHSDRVSGLYFDPRNMNLFSCSYDMTLFSVDLNDNLYSKSLVYNNTSGFTGLKYMKNNNLLITSDKDGIILIFSIENFHYKYYLNFQSTSLYKINTMDIFGNYVIAGGNNGKVSVFNLTLVKNKIIKEIISFDIGLYKIICIYYNPGNDEIIIGDEIGRIIIWDNKIRSFIYSLITNSQVKINHLWIEDNKNLIWFCGDDKMIKKWKIPKKWYKENIYLYMNNMNFNGKMKHNNFLDLEDNDSISSDEDELNGWSNK